MDSSAVIPEKSDHKSFAWRSLFGSTGDGKKPMGFLLLLSVFLMRLTVVFLAGNPGDGPTWASWTIDPDSHSYLALAGDLSDGVQDSASTRTPGYPAFLLAVSPDPGASSLAPVLIQQVIDLMTALIIGSMAVQTGCRAGWIASLCYLLLPAAAATSSRILPDTLLALTSAASGLLWLRAARTGKAGSLIGLYGLIGLILSIGSLLKPVFLFAPAVYLMLIPAVRIRTGPVRILAILTLLAVSVAGPLAWRLHNRAAFDMDAISTQDGFEQTGRIWVLTGRATQLEFITSVKDSVEALSSRSGEIDYELRNRIYREMAIEELERHPMDVIIPHLTSWPRFFTTGIGNTMRYLGIPQDSGVQLPIQIASALLILLLPGGFVAGLAVPSVRKRVGPLLLLSGAWMIVISAVQGPLTGPRYGLTFFPLLCAAGITSLCLLRSSLKATKVKGTSAQ
jgi:4-amino-4-deoxy-L-arabinose transferase-like glycosyltransferase